MRVKLDENVPHTLVEPLRASGYDVDTVGDEGLVGGTDPEVWAAAQRDQRFFITQDLDFSDARAFAPGTHHGILLVRLASPGRRRLESYLRALIATEDLRAWAKCLVVATDSKLRFGALRSARAYGPGTPS